jgi:hypothetical protein
MMENPSGRCSKKIDNLQNVVEQTSKTGSKQTRRAKMATNKYYTKPQQLRFLIEFWALFELILWLVSVLP